MDMASSAATPQISGHLLIHPKSEAVLEPAGLQEIGRAGAEEEGHSISPPPFLSKTYDIVDDPLTDAVISWAYTGGSFVVWDPHAFSASLLPRSFKHSNFSSFVRQLNTYGFKKVDPDRWEFANEGFVKGQKNLLKHIHRRKSHHLPRNRVNTVPCTLNMMENESTTYCEEVNAMKREKNILLMEVIRLRQCQLEAEEHIKDVLNRLHVVERRQHHMVAFIARALHNPGFISQLVGDSSSLDWLKMRQLLPTSEVSGTLELPSFLNPDQLQDPDEDDHGSFMLLEFLAADVNTETAHLEALIQEMEHSTSTTYSDLAEKEEAGSWGSCTSCLPVDVGYENKHLGIVGQGPSQNTEFGLPYLLMEGGDNIQDLERMGSFNCEDADALLEQLMSGIGGDHPSHFENPRKRKGHS